MTFWSSVILAAVVGASFGFCSLRWNHHIICGFWMIWLLVSVVFCLWKSKAFIHLWKGPILFIYPSGLQDTLELNSPSYLEIDGLFVTSFQLSPLPFRNGVPGLPDFALSSANLHPFVDLLISHTKSAKGIYSTVSPTFCLFSSFFLHFFLTTTTFINHPFHILNINNPTTENKSSRYVFAFSFCKIKTHILCIASNDQQVVGSSFWSLQHLLSTLRPTTSIKTARWVIILTVVCFYFRDRSIMVHGHRWFASVENIIAHSSATILRLFTHFQIRV